MDVPGDISWQTAVEHFGFLKIAKSEVLTNIDLHRSDTKPDHIKLLQSHWLEFNNGCKYRIIFPLGIQPFLDECGNGCNINELWFVGFFGTIKSPCNHSVSEKIWQLDSDLEEDIKSNGRIICYFTAERIRGGNHFNLVLLSKPDGLDVWNQSPRHDIAAGELSRLFYSQVRIHRGYLGQGLTSEKFLLHRTLCADYDRNGNTIKRFVKFWKKEDEMMPSEHVELN